MSNDHSHIQKLTEYFVSESLYNEDPAGLCFSTSFLLQVYLATREIKSSLIKGEVPQQKNDEKLPNVPHYWLQIDTTDTIVDATIMQFNSHKPIYVGRLQDNEITKTYIPNKLEFCLWFPNDFDSWKKPYEDPKYPLDGPFEKRSITYTIKLATILYTEIKKLISVNEFINYYLGLYFKPIYIFLYHWQVQIINFEMEKEVMPTGFDSLLSEVMQWAEEHLKINH